MTFSIRLAACLTLLSGLFLQSFAHAEESNSDDFHWEVDLGLVLNHQKALIEGIYDIDAKIDLNLWLSGGLYYKNFFMESTPKRERSLVLGYTLHESKEKQINLITSSRFFPFSEEDQDEGNHKLDGIKPRDGSMELGLELNYRFADYDTQFQILHDALSVHHGSLLSVNISKPIFTANTMFLPSIGAAFITQNAIDYYYGVDFDEATLTRPEYTPSSSWAANVRLYVERPISESWSFISSASFTYVGKEISDSPLVDNDYGYNINIGVLWVF